MDDDCLAAENMEVSGALDTTGDTDNSEACFIVNMLENVLRGQPTPGPACNVIADKTTVQEQLRRTRRGRNGNTNGIVNWACGGWACILQYGSYHQKLHHKCQVRNEILVDGILFLFQPRNVQLLSWRTNKLKKQAGTYYNLYSIRLQ